MQYKAVGLFLIASVVSASSTAAQTETARKANDGADSVALARCAYTQAGAVCQGSLSANDDTTLAQLDRRPPGPPLRSRRATGYPRYAYPGMWAHQGNERHALIGAAIGFGLGAAMGAKGNRDQHPGAGISAAILIGTFGAMIGAAVGYAGPSYHTRNHDQPSASNKDQIASRCKAAATGSTASGSPSAMSATLPSAPNPEDPVSPGLGAP